MTNIWRVNALRTALRRHIAGVSATILMAILTAACTTPGAIAPSTIPLGTNYVGISEKETRSSCGYTVLMIPVGFSQPVSDVIADMIASRGGDALVDVSSQSWTTWYVVGVANCFEITGKVVKISR